MIRRRCSPRRRRRRPRTTSRGGLDNEEPFDEQLAQLHREFIEMGALCERVIALASRALTTGDKTLAQQVPPLDRDIDRKERDIETCACGCCCTSSRWPATCGVFPPR